MNTPMIIGIAYVVGDGVVFPIDIDANVVISAGVVRKAVMIVQPSLDSDAVGVFPACVIIQDVIIGFIEVNAVVVVRVADVVAHDVIVGIPCVDTGFVVRVAGIVAYGVILGMLYVDTGFVVRVAGVVTYDVMIGTPQVDTGFVVRVAGIVTYDAMIGTPQVDTGFVVRVAGTVAYDVMIGTPQVDTVVVERAVILDNPIVICCDRYPRISVTAPRDQKTAQDHEIPYDFHNVSIPPTIDDSIP